MKYPPILLFATAGLLSVLLSCSSGNTVEDLKSAHISILGDKPSEKTTTVTSTSTPAGKSPAYERGLAVGRRISICEPDSPEREKALIEAHSMVSSLRRNGYARSADDFELGINDALAH